MPKFLLLLALLAALPAPAQRLVLVAGGGRDTNTTQPLPATQARLGSPFGVDFDAAGRLYLVEMTGQRVRRLDPDGRLSVLAGTGAKGHRDGPVAQAEFNGIHNLAILDGQLLLADT